MDATDAASRNRLLAALEPDDLRRLAPHLERVDLARGTVLLEPGAELRHVWWPEDCVVSLVIPTREGAAAEAATIGREGMVGFIAALGVPPPSPRPRHGAGARPGPPPTLGDAPGGLRGEPARPSGLPLLRRGADRPRPAIGGVQRAAHGRGAARPLAAAAPGPDRRYRGPADHPGAAGRDAGGAADHGLGSRAGAAAGGPDRVQMGQRDGARPGGAGEGVVRVLRRDPGALRAGLLLHPRLIAAWGASRAGPGRPPPVSRPSAPGHASSPVDPASGSAGLGVRPARLGD